MLTSSWTSYSSNCLPSEIYQVTEHDFFTMLQPGYYDLFLYIF